MVNTFVCPHCGKNVELSEALSHEIESKFKAEGIKALEEAKKQIEQEALNKAETRFELLIKNTQEEATETKKRSQELQEQILELSRQLRKALQEKDEAKLEVEKRLAEEEQKIRQKATSDAFEQYRLKEKEKDLLIDGLKKSLDEANRKANQGSQQTQGEALELELENVLRQEFPNDKLSEVKKGVRGGDLVQEVWDKNGNRCGSILWEFKNTNAWSDGWVDKLKQDQRLIKAETAIILSQVLPKDIRTAGYRKGVWVTSQSFAIVLVMGLRANIIQICQVKKSLDGKNGKMEIMWNYLSGNEFNQRMLAMGEAFDNMQTEIEREKRYFAAKWARDEKNIRLLIDNTQGLRGELDSIMQNSLPSSTLLLKNSKDSDGELAA